jgi:hypothetical protein
MGEAVKAKRGDLAVRETTVSNFHVREGIRSHTQVTIGRVTSVTREGVVKTTQEPFTGGDEIGWGSWSRARDQRSNLRIVPKDAVDVAGVLTKFAERRYPSAPHSLMVLPLESFDEARELVRPFLTRSGVS